MGQFTQVLRYAGTLYQRAFLAVAATLYALTTLLGPNLDTFQACSTKLPHVLVLPPHYELWTAGFFAVDAAMLWWRIFDFKSRVVMGTIANFYTAMLWLSVTIAGLFVYDGVWSANIGEIMMTLTSLFVLTRTDYNASDKVSA